MKTDYKQTLFIYYLLALSLVGMSLTFIVTYRYGAGFSTDGAKYISTAENLIHGRGFYDYLGNPLTQFPPVYPLIIAGIGYVTGMDVFMVGQYLNLITFGVVIWLAGLFFRRIFPDDIIYAIIGSAFFTTSISLIRIASNILSDLVFMALAIIFLAAATRLLEEPTRKNIFILGLIACVSPLERYAGLAFIFTGSILLIFLYRRDIKKGLFFAGGFGIFTSLPVMLWGLFHNYLRTGILFGLHTPPSIKGNLEITIEKAVHWFIPYSLTNLIPISWLCAIILLVLLTGNRLHDWKRWGALLASPKFFPSVVFLGSYMCVLVFKASYSELRWPFMDRIHIIILPELLALGFLTARELKPFYLRQLQSKTLRFASILIFVLWLIYPINNIQKYIRSAYSNGEISEYNLYNTRAQNESGLKEYIASLSLTSEDKVYSNYEAIAWLYSRKTILKLPQGLAEQKNPNPELVLQNYPTWPGNDGEGYVIWMKKLGFKSYVLSPDQLTSRADFQMIFTSKEGDVYILTTK